MNDKFFKSDNEVQEYLNGDKDIQMYIELTRHKKELDVALIKTKAKLLALEQKLLNNFTEQGRSSVTQDGATVYLQKRTFAKVIGDDGDENGEAMRRAVLAIKDAGPELSFLIRETFPMQSLSKILKEYKDDGRDLPESFKGVIDTVDIYKVLVRKSTKGDK